MMVVVVFHIFVEYYILHIEIPSTRNAQLPKILEQIMSELKGLTLIWTLLLIEFKYPREILMAFTVNENIPTLFTFFPYGTKLSEHKWEPESTRTYFKILSLRMGHSLRV